MIEIVKKNVVIPLSQWNELKKDDYFKEIIEVLEDSDLLEKTKQNSKGSVDFNDYVRERENKELKKAGIKKNKAKN